jgi:tetratricopeptide (TPR) repeat protein
MKTFHLFLVCVCAQFAFTLSAENISKTDSPAQAAELARQANVKLQEASSPQDFRAAAALLEKSVRLDPENLDVRQTLGWIYLNKLQEPQKAYPHLAKLAKNRPDDVTARKLFAMACSQTGRSHQAVEEFRAAAQLQPGDLWIRANLARSLARTGNYGEAETIYAETLKADPANADARLGEAEIAAWRGHNAGPLQTLDQLIQENPENTEALTLRGDIQRWNWDLTGAKLDYQQVLNLEENNYTAKNGLAEAQAMGALGIGVTAYQFKDTTKFLREYLEADGRVPIADHAYLIGDVAGWRFTNPGFSHLDRRDADAGMEFDFARWLQITGQGTVFDYVQTNNRAYFGGQITAKISPMTGTDIYLNGAYNQPFVSSISTVESAMRQHSLGAGLDTKLVGRFSFQTEAQGAKLSDDNKWWEAKPRLSYRLFDKPKTFVRVQYDYLSYSRTNANYWTPNNYHTVGPVLDISIPICKGFHLDGDGKAPYVFDQSKFGYQAEGGPVIDLSHHVQAKASYYYSKIPGDEGAWSGHGWQASLQVKF